MQRGPAPGKQKVAGGGRFKVGELRPVAVAASPDRPCESVAVASQERDAVRRGVLKPPEPFIDELDKQKWSLTEELAPAAEHMPLGSFDVHLDRID